MQDYVFLLVLQSETPKWVLICLFTSGLVGYRGGGRVGEGVKNPKLRCKGV